MERFDRLVQEFQALVPFRIRYKEEAWEMQFLQALIGWFCPGFLTRFTTVIGSTVYFPNRAYVELYPEAAMRTLAHEAVHLMDADRLSWPVFGFAYLFPQILAAGVLLFPWLGLWALAFLVFLLPIPAPFRARFEARAYALDMLTARPDQRQDCVEGAIQHFESWNYYRMYPFPDLVEEQLYYWAETIESGQEKTLLKILLVYEWIKEGQL